MIENIDYLISEGFCRSELNHVFGVRLVNDTIGPSDDDAPNVDDVKDSQIEELKQRLDRAHRKIDRLEKTIKGYQKTAEKLARAEAHIKSMQQWR